MNWNITLSAQTIEKKNVNHTRSHPWWTSPDAPWSNWISPTKAAPSWWPAKGPRFQTAVLKAIINKWPSRGCIRCGNSTLPPSLPSMVGWQSTLCTLVDFSRSSSKPPLKSAQRPNPARQERQYAQSRRKQKKKNRVKERRLITRIREWDAWL